LFPGGARAPTNKKIKKNKTEILRNNLVPEIIHAHPTGFPCKGMQHDSCSAL
jgi:hypothetical protein